MRISDWSSDVCSSDLWGQSQWVESLPRLINDGWKSIGGTGYFGSLAYQVTSRSAQPPDHEIISAELTSEVAAANQLRHCRRAYPVPPSLLTCLPPTSATRDLARGAATCQGPLYTL